MAKLDKAVVLYMPASVLNPQEPREGARCGRCMMYMPDLRACTIVYIESTGAKSTRVDGERGVCGLFVGGASMNSNAMHKPMPTVPRRVAGYIESAGVPTHCGDCRYYSPQANTGRGLCAKVEGVVEDYGCCNHWEKGL